MDHFKSETKKVKVNGNELSVLLFSMEEGGEQGVLTTHLPELLGVTKQAIGKMIGNNGLELSTLGLLTQKALRSAGVIAKTGPLPMFAPKGTIRALVKRVGTPKAEAIYNQLWDVAEAVHTGNLMSAQQQVGLGYEAILANTEALAAALRQSMAQTQAEQAAHGVTKATSKIADAEIDQLERAVKSKARIIDSILRWFSSRAQYQVEGIIKRMIKAKFTRANPQATFKEIPRSELVAVLDFVEKVTPDLVEVAGKYGNDTRSLGALAVELQTRGYC